MRKPVRCVNLDWLELYVLEPLGEPHTADYFRQCGFSVRERDYGTRVYQQMFVLEDKLGEPFIEVRRAPKSVIGQGGILMENASHIRLVNRYCYHNQAAQLMKEFINRYGYTDARISRVDVALDFVIFDSGDMPGKFLERFMQGRYCKINQANIHSHGTDGWGSRVWNSVSWGSPKSQISTKFYCKSLELRQVKDKPYIRQAWFECGLISDPVIPLLEDVQDKDEKPDVWRIEFSITSSVKGWYRIEENGESKKIHSFRNNLDVYDGRAALWTVWASLANHYFHFKYYQEGRRKDKCPDKVLFNLVDPCDFYHVERLASARPALTELQRLSRKLVAFKETHYDEETKRACDFLLSLIRDEHHRDDGGCGFTRAELLALQMSISGKVPYLSNLNFILANYDDLF